MKKLLLTVIAAFALSGLVFAQESHYNVNSSYENWDLLLTYAQIDGVFITPEDNWADMELASFVGDECRGAIFLLDETDLGDEYPAAQLPVYYDNNGEEVTYRMYDHGTGIEYAGILNISYVTGDGDHNEIWLGGDPLIINFTAMAPAYETFTKDIVGYGDESNVRGFYLIASPIVEEVIPSAEYGFLTSSYDLYFFDGSYPAKEWRNFEDTITGGYNLVSGKGYLYASQEDTQLTFTGTPYSGDGVVELEYSDAPFGGWNLVGNPFAEQALPNREYLILNTGEEGDDFIPGEGGVEAMEGIMVYAEAEGETVTFNPSNGEGGEDKLTINLTKSCVRGTVDRAIVKFGEGRTLPKFQMNPNHTKVYIPQDGTDYAVVSAPEMGEMPVNFKAETNGSYTMSFGSENVTFSYLHLIDNLTGADVDLLATPSYTFDASTTDYASRFRLVFATGGNNDGDSFAFFSNGSFVVSNEGEATLQVVDVMGRILKSENISGSASVKVDAASGVYMLRLVNGNDVKVQKVVVE